VGGGGHVFYFSGVGGRVPSGFKKKKGDPPDQNLNTKREKKRHKGGRQEINIFRHRGALIPPNKKFSQGGKLGGC